MSGEPILRALALAAMLGAGCATVDVYSYAPKQLPAGMTPLDAIHGSLQQLRNVNWASAAPAPVVGVQRARAGADSEGIYATVVTATGWTRPTLYLTYRQIASQVRAVTQSGGTWKVHLREAEFEFENERAVRLFLDGATALARRTAYSLR